MLPNLKHFALVLTILALIILSLIAAGTHISSIIQGTSFLIVSSAALGTLYLSLGSRATMLLKFLFLRLGPTPTIREISIFEKCVFLGGFVGTAIGIIHAIANFHRPDLIGPGVAVSFVSLAYSLIINLCISIPANLDICSSHNTASITKTKIAFPLWHIIIVLLSVSGVTFGSFLEGANLKWFLSVPAILTVIILPLVIYCFYFPKLRETDLDVAFTNLGNAALAGGILATIFMLIDLMENLDKPDAIPLRAALSIVPAMYGLIGIATGKLKTEAIEKKGTCYLPFGTFALSALAIICLMVIFALKAVN